MLVGQPAPAFELQDQNRNPVSTDSLKGSNTLLVFIPFPFTGICDGETCTIRDNLADLNDVDAKVVIISVHATTTLKKWADENGFEFPVLSDYWPHGETAKAYGAFNEERGCANRYTVVLDAAGVVREVINTDSLGTPREFAAYAAALAKL